MPHGGAGLFDVRYLASQPSAARWAQCCAWIPGTGHCRDRDCSHACLFRTRREAETRRLERWRRKRRISVQLWLR